jgi:hypothetical protein
MSIKPAHVHSTTRQTEVGRVRVEDGSTTQATGQQFDILQEFAAIAAPTVIKIVAPLPIDIDGMELNILLNGGNLSIFEASAGTEGGTFTPITPVSSNQRLNPAPSFSASTGGTFVATEPPLRRMSAQAAANSSSVRANNNRMSLPAGTYFAVTGLLSGVLSLTGETVITISEVIQL